MSPMIVKLKNTKATPDIMGYTVSIFTRLLASHQMHILAFKVNMTDLVFLRQYHSDNGHMNEKISNITPKILAISLENRDPAYSNIETEILI